MPYMTVAPQYDHIGFRPLHGMGQDAGAGVPNGATLTYSGQWELGVILDANSIVQRVTAALPADGIQVTDAQINQSYLSSWGFEGTAQFGVTLKLTIIGAGFAQAADVQAIINHEYYNVMGKMPVASSMTAPPTTTTVYDAATTTTNLPSAGNIALWVGIAAVALVGFFVAQRL